MHLGMLFFLGAVVLFLVGGRFFSFDSVRYFQAVMLVQFMILAEFVYSAFDRAADILKIRMFKISYKND